MLESRVSARGWLYARNSLAGVGLVPESYLEHKVRRPVDIPPATAFAVREGGVTAELVTMAGDALLERFETPALQATRHTNATSNTTRASPRSRPQWRSSWHAKATFS